MEKAGINSKTLPLTYTHTYQEGVDLAHKLPLSLGSEEEMLWLLLRKMGPIWLFVVSVL